MLIHFLCHVKKNWQDMPLKEMKSQERRLTRKMYRILLANTNFWIYFLQKTVQTGVWGNGSVKAAHSLAALKSLTAREGPQTTHSKVSYFFWEWRTKSRGVTNVIVPMATHCIHRGGWQARKCIFWNAHTFKHWIVHIQSRWNKCHFEMALLALQKSYTSMTPLLQALT